MVLGLSTFLVISIAMNIWLIAWIEELLAGLENFEGAEPEPLDIDIIQMVDLSTGRTFRTFANVEEACEFLKKEREEQGIHTKVYPQSINRVLQGKAQSAYGYDWCTNKKETE